MTKEAIYNALNPDWWVLSPANSWNTEFISTVINFDTSGTTGCSYTSSAPYQTNGLNAGTSQFINYLSEQIDSLRLEAAQRLYDMHATQITGHTSLEYVYGAIE